jgi:voltage-gated sodium channel
MAVFLHENSRIAPMHSSMISVCKRISKSGAFQGSVIAAIVFSSVLVGLETYPALVAQYGDTLLLLDKIVLALFTFEIAVKMLARGRNLRLYFYDPWNVFDFLIVAVCFLPLCFAFFAPFRIIRILRVLRLITVIPRMQFLVGALLKSLPSIGYVSLLLLVLFYVYAVLGTYLFGGNDPIHFASLPISMVTLFRVVTLEDWTDVMYIQMYGSDSYNADAYASLSTVPSAMPIVSVLYFLSFVLFGTMIVLNLFVGVILNGMQEIQAEADLDKILEHQRQGRLTIADEMQLLTSQIVTLQSSLDAIQKRMRDGESSSRTKRYRAFKHRKQLKVLQGGSG